jgi:hypothetical protein
MKILVPHCYDHILPCTTDHAVFLEVSTFLDFLFLDICEVISDPAPVNIVFRLQTAKC